MPNNIIGRASDKLIERASALTEGDPLNAIAALALSAAAIASAAGIDRKKVLEAFNTAWDQCEGLRT
jgi:2-methylcitrate dehydratase PrpD